MSNSIHSYQFLPYSHHKDKLSKIPIKPLTHQVSVSFLFTGYNHHLRRIQILFLSTAVTVYHTSTFIIPIAGVQCCLCHLIYLPLRYLMCRLKIVPLLPPDSNTRNLSGQNRQWQFVTAGMKNWVVNNDIIFSLQRIGDYIASLFAPCLEYPDFVGLFVYWNWKDRWLWKKNLSV